MANRKRVMIDPNYSKFDLEVEPQENIIEISEEVINTLSWLFAWNNNAKKWKPALSDSTGRLLVSTSESQTDTTTQSQADVTTTSSLLLAANEDRKAFSIFNEGSDKCYIRLSTDDATNQHLPIPSGAFYSDSLYFGEINAICDTDNGDLRVTEYV